MAQSRGKEASLENVGTINISTAAIRRMDDSVPAIAGVLSQDLHYLNARLAKRIIHLPIGTSCFHFIVELNEFLTS
ncbi:hypothetical protein PITC_038160 [Penicillium italicum]|uniref:Uncharacterized protein n=1 Tax=Penicillium italicum TaxID=40296 RepID=A0A0A2L516_PENIT|nr:hypothetical protein PITC_038160 [Penicillium italicum]